MGITVAFPSGWIVRTSRRSCLRTRRRQAGRLEMWAQAPPPGTTPREFLGRMLHGVPPSEASRSRSTACRATRRSRSTQAALGQPGTGALSPSSISTTWPTCSIGCHAADLGAAATDPVFLISSQDIPPPARQRVPEVASRTGSEVIQAATPGTTIERLAQDVADQEVPGRTAAAAERPVPGQGARGRARRSRSSISDGPSDQTAASCNPDSCKPARPAALTGAPVSWIPRR